MEYIGTGIKIREVQKVQLDILLEFDRVCKMNNIPYQLFAGTLLGAIRHKGFIPWDDDIDVCLLRKDYERFLECCEKVLSPDYFLQSYKSDKRSYFQFAKLRRNNTLFINPVVAGSGMHNGIYIDIFPLDNVMPDTVFGKLQPWAFQVLYIMSSSRLKNRALHARNKFNRYCRLVLHYLLKIIPKGLTDWAMQGILRLFENKDVIYVNHLTNGVTKRRLAGFLREKKSFYGVQYKEFEGHLFPVPQDYHNVLTRQYGDYMKPPPEDKRYPHHGITKVVFNINEGEISS